MSDLRSEELDRHLTFDRCTGSDYDVTSVSVNNKKLTMNSEAPQTVYSTGYYSRGDFIYKCQITFQKMNGKKDAIEIEVLNWMKQQRKCNLGHSHEEYDWSEWQRFAVSWEMMEQLIEWFQNGRFYDARTRQAKKNGGPFHSKAKVK